MPRLFVALRPTLGIMLLNGCLSPNTYSTPRTIGPGQVSHSVAAEGANWVSNSSSPVTQKEGLSHGGAPMAAYTMRVGVTPRIDLGFRVAAPLVGLDAKANFVRSEYFDLALAPGLQVGWQPTEHSNQDHSYGALHIPLLVGLNLSRSFSIVASAGYSQMLGQCNLVTILQGEMPVSGPLLRVGLGLDIRATARFALHPEVTVMQQMNGDQRPLDKLWIFGVGFNWGALPTFE